MPSTATRSLVLALLVTPLATADARAEVYEVKAGDDWSLLGPKLVAGDEVVLLEGVHVPAQFSGLAGEAGKPIVIRSWEPSKLAEFTPAREALKLTDCRHVRVERLFIKSMRRAGIILDSTAPGLCSDIVVQDTLVRGVDGLVEQAGLLVLGAQRVAVLRSRFEDCRGSALHLELASDVRVERLQVHGRKPATLDFGVQILGESSDLAFNDLSITGTVSTAISVGAKDAVSRGPRVPVVPEVPAAPQAQATSTASNARTPAPGAPTTAASDAAPAQPQTAPAQPQTSPAQPQTSPAQPPVTPAPAAMVRNVTFEHVLIRNADHAFEFGSCDGVTVANSTIVDASASIFRLVRPLRGRAGALVRFRENIVTWGPGGLRMIVDAVEGAPTAGLRLGPNIWWSNELPSALPLLGPESNPFQGTLEVPQTIDIDPELDDGARPLREDAKMFGRNVR